MCGILAVVNERLSEHILKSAVDTLAHRGPDGCGVYLDKKWGVSLAHRRLAIIDPVNSAQPIFSADRHLVLICNGMIYDFQQHRAELGRSGYPFQTRGDSEVLLALYQRYGMSFLERVDGEFAFILLDIQRGKLFAARDRFGVKPLYYSETRHGSVFASEAKCIFATGLIKPSFNVAAIRDNFCGLFTDSVFEHIQSVPASSCLTIDLQNKKLTTHTYWSLPHGMAEAKSFDLQTAKTGLVEQINQAVRRRLTAEKRVGVYLSGGIDSAIIARSALEQQPNIKFYHLCFDGLKHQRDRERARDLAHELKADYTEVEVDDQRLLAAVEEYLWYAELPTHNCHGAAKYLLSKRAADDVSVTLTGEGADEIFLGYPYFIRGYRNSIKDLFACAINLGARHSPHPMTNLRCSKLYQLLIALPFENRHRGPLIKHSPVPAISRYSPGKKERSNTWRLQNFSIMGRLAQYIIPVLGDRCEMAHGIEGRPPYLDKRLVEYACTLPNRAKIRRGVGKHLLREILKDGGSASFSSTKKSFMSPVLAVKFGESLAMDNMITRYLSIEVIQSAGVFSPRVITQLLRLRAHDLLPAPINKKIDGILMFVMTVHILHKKFINIQHGHPIPR